MSISTCLDTHSREVQQNITPVSAQMFCLSVVSIATGLLCEVANKLL